MKITRKTAKEILKLAEQLETNASLIDYWRGVFDGEITTENREDWKPYFEALKTAPPDTQSKCIEQASNVIERAITKLKDIR